MWNIRRWATRLRIPSLRSLLLGLLAAFVCLLGCGRPDHPLPSVLRFGVLPDQDVEALQRRYQPLLRWLSKETGRDCELLVPSSYDHLLDLFHTAAVDVARFGGHTFVRSRLRDGAVPLVMRDVDMRFTSVFLVRSDDTATTLSALRGGKLGFGSRLSTSGHLMPRYFLSHQGMLPELFFESVEYSGTHDATALWVRDGRVDVGGANSTIIRAMYQDGRLAEGDVRVLWETPPYVNYVWAIRPALGERPKVALRTAFLKLSPAQPHHRRILDLVGAGGYLPADVDDFARLLEIVETLDTGS